jgi:predicted transcriptional regulator
MDMLKIGIMQREEFQRRVLNIACGRYKPAKDEPKVWFHSIKSLSELLNESNVRLLKMIEKEKPKSLKALSGLSGRQVSNLSRTLKKMANYGIVELEKNSRSVRPIAKATSFNIMYL